MSESSANLSRADLQEKIRKLEAIIKQDRNLHSMIHELQVHQEEIQVQNQQLMEAQSALEESRDRYANLYDFAPVAYVTLDENGVIREINLTGAALLGADRRSILGTPFSLYVAEGDRTKFYQHLRRCHGPDPLVVTEMLLRPKNGGPAPVHLMCNRSSRSGEQITFRTVIFDLTERQRIEEERSRLITKERAAEARNEAKDRFLAVLSHELRTPLTPILAIIGDLESALGVPPQVRSDLFMIHRNIELEARLIDDLLDLTSISRGKLQLHPRTVDVHEVVGYVIETLEENLQGRHLGLGTRLEAEDRFVNADPGRLQQVLWNLLKNAIKFTPEGGQITISTRNVVDGGQGADQPECLPIAIEITDTGIGIEPEKLPILFNAFEQIDQRITKEYGGLGLGLAISKGLVEAHGGKITASSAGKGKGATFQVDLSTVPAPRKEEGMAGTGGLGIASAAALQPESRKSRVLLVEDHHDTAMILSRLLKNRGFHVETADSLESANAIFTKGIDLLISDLALPDGSGLELMRRLHARHSNLPGIALSGFGTDQDIRRSREAGFIEHLTKPVDFQVIVSTIERVMREVRPVEDVGSSSPPKPEGLESEQRVTS